MQKAIIVEGEYSLRELNQLLDKGYTVVSTCPMPSGVGSTYSSDTKLPTCLVIVERK